jgi:hypothetical protein
MIDTKARRRRHTLETLGYVAVILLVCGTVWLMVGGNETEGRHHGGYVPVYFFSIDAIAERVLADESASRLSMSEQIEMIERAEAAARRLATEGGVIVLKADASMGHPDFLDITHAVIEEMEREGVR